LFLFLLTGCSTTRHVARIPEAETPTLTERAPEAAEDSTAVRKERPRPDRRRIQRAAETLEKALGDETALSVERLCILLTDSTITGTIAQERHLELLRTAFKRYREMIPPSALLRPNSVMARLLDAIPDSLRSHLREDVHFRELYVRKLAGSADVPVDYNSEVVKTIRYFQTTARKAFKAWLSRSPLYVPMIREALRDAGLPEDLVFKAMIESGFNPRAYSRARAVGIWQFVWGTARLYGLKNDGFIDERRDPEKSTRAAIRHIRHLYGLFGDWRLVIAAYNCGQGRLQRIIQRSRTDNFWRLRGLPRETRRHVPRFMAALIISKDPEWFGFDDVVYRTPEKYDSVPVMECVDLRVAAECAGTSYTRLRVLNPELYSGYTPPGRQRPYYLRIPAGAADRFRANYARIPATRKPGMVEYTMRYGDTVSGIARRFRTSTKAVLSANNISNPRRIRAGTRLKIPIFPNARPARAARTPARVASPDPDTHRKVAHRVKKGDTLWGIGRRYGVTPNQIRSWNNIKRHITPGDRLVIWRPAARQIVMANPSDQRRGEFYIVRSGDTLWDIARSFRVRVNDLKKWNRIRKPGSLRVGARLLIRPSGSRAAD
jgi:membrane-bound lytic murein transglycosylase D